MAKTFEEEITRLVAEIIEVPENKLDPDADFFNVFGVDSMKAIEIVASIEKQLKIIVPEAEISKVRTLNHVFALARKLQSAKLT